MGTGPRKRAEFGATETQYQEDNAMLHLTGTHPIKMQKDT